MSSLASLLISMVLMAPLSIAQTTAPVADDSTHIYKADDPGITKPKVIKMVDPEFTDEAHRENLSGRCMVSLIVEVDGKPKNAHIVRCTNDLFAPSSLDSVSRYLFQPATKADGTPVPFELSIIINYVLNGGSPTVASNFKIAMRTPPGITSTEPDANGIYPFSKNTQPPNIGKFSDEGFGNAGFGVMGESSCDITLTIDAKGNASNAELLKCSQKNLEEPAVKSLLKTKYKPGTVNGQPAPIRVTIHLEYVGLAKNK